MIPFHFTIVTIFPEIFSGFFSSSLIGKAREKDLISLETLNPRDFASPPHFKVDDAPYGGGPGMVMIAEPLVLSIEKIKETRTTDKVILLSASASKFTQDDAKRLSLESGVVFIAGRYEGVDERVKEFIDEEFSIGEYVLMGGEVPSMVMIEAIARLIPGVVGNEESIRSESYFENENFLEAPQYTRPEIFRGKAVPPVLLSGHHKEIEKWRTDQSQQKGRRK